MEPLGSPTSDPAERARREERHRLATELHDDALQVMATVALRLELLEREAEGRARVVLDELRETVSSALQRLRMLTSDLQVAELTELDLGAALKGILEDIERGYPISFSLEDRVGNLAHPLLAVGLQRIAREALINVTKHARATHIDVVITELKGGIQVTIADNGVGFEEGDVRSDAHMGLLSMRSRVLSLGGEFQIHSPAEGGTRIEVWVPDP